MPMSTRFSFWLGILLLAGYSLQASDYLVSPEWLMAQPEDADIRVVDVSFEGENFIEGHIPGAVFVHWKDDLSDENQAFYRVPTQEAFESIMSGIGATPETQLIFYDNRQNRFAIRGMWVAGYYGHENAAVLEGGIEAWMAAGFPLETGRAEVEATRYQVQEMKRGMNVNVEYVKKNLRNPEVIFVDSRPWSMFTGETPGIMIDKGEEVARIGHLPGALSLPWKENLTQNHRFLRKEDLRELYSGKGVDPQKIIIFYCNEGLHAAFNWFVTAKLLGMERVKIYEGSMGEWASETMRPLVSGVGF